MEDASLTQPLSQEKMRHHPPASQQYSELLINAGVLSREEVDLEISEIYEEFEAEHLYSQLQGARP